MHFLSHGKVVLKLQCTPESPECENADSLSLTQTLSQTLWRSAQVLACSYILQVIHTAHTLRNTVLGHPHSLDLQGMWTVFFSVLSTPRALWIHRRKPGMAMPPRSWNEAWITRPHCYYQSGAAQDSSHSLLCRGENHLSDSAKFPLLPLSLTNPRLSCGRNSVMTIRDQLGYGLCSSVSVWGPPPPPPPPHTPSSQPWLLCGLDSWFRSILGPGAEEAVEGSRVGYFVGGLPLASSPFCIFCSNACTPSANLSSFPASPNHCYPNQWLQYPPALSSDASPYPSPLSSRKPLICILRVRDRKSGKASWRRLHRSWALKNECDFHREGWTEAALQQE